MTSNCYNEQKTLRKHGDGDDASAVQRVVGYKEEEYTQSCLTMLKKCIRTNIASCWKVLVPGTHRVSYHRILDIGENKSLEQIFAHPLTF